MTEPLPGAVVYAKDHVAVAAFYRDVIGLTETSSERDHCVLESAHTRLVVQRIPEHIAADIDITQPPTRREDTAIKLLFVVDDLAATRQRVAETGGVIDPPDRAWTFQGHVRCDGHDPEGNPVQVIARG